MAQWTRRLTTNQEIPGSTPGSFTFATKHFICQWDCHIIFPCLLLFTYIVRSSDNFGETKFIFEIDTEKAVSIICGQSFILVRNPVAVRHSRVGEGGGLLTPSHTFDCQ